MKLNGKEVSKKKAINVYRYQCLFFKVKQPSTKSISKMTAEQIYFQAKREASQQPKRKQVRFLWHMIYKKRPNFIQVWGEILKAKKEGRSIL